VAEMTGSVTALESPIARSPIRQAPPNKRVGLWEVSGKRTSASLRLADLSPLAKVRVRDRSPASGSERLGVVFGRARRGYSGNLVIGDAPGEWFVLGPSGHESAILTDLEATAAGTFTTVLEMTHGYAVVRLTGEEAGVVVSKLCPVDMSARAAPNGTVVRTLLAGIMVGVVRDDADDEASFLFYCERSSGQYLFDVVMDAGAEFAVEVDGYPEVEI
jgi:heterotetrameric sarcosine oxidase gamma subunit